MARIRLAVDVVESTPEKAFETANAAVARLREVLREHGIDDAGVSESRLSLQSLFEGYGSTRTFLGFQCQAAFVVETMDLVGLQQLLVDVVAAGTHRLDSVEFDASNKAELRNQARVEAVKTAKRKAEVYADACDVALGPVIHIQDQDRHAESPRRLSMASSDAGGTNLVPGRVVIESAVLLGFSLPRA